MMRPIELLYAKNVISRAAEVAEQQLEFSILVENLGYDKLVEVHWAGEDDVWQILKARYQYGAGNSRELWRARTGVRVSRRRPLPGNVRFALRYRVLGKDYWDNNRSQNYRINSDSGVMTPDGVSLQDVGFSPHLYRGQRHYPILVAVRQHLHPKYVSIHWTTDRWKTHNQTPCFFQTDYWHHTLRSNAGNPNSNGSEIWKNEIVIGDAFRVEYAVSCDTGNEKIWDSNFGSNYLASRESLKVLTLNLHCYQEDRQDDKFDQIVKAIAELKIDVVCLQEVAENWNEGNGDWKTNSAKIIRDRLKRFYNLSYYLHTDWSHIGFDRYREGTAVLSRYKFLAKDSGYISQSQDPYDIHARKVVMVQVHVPYMGLVNVFSVHLSWVSDGFQEQFESLRRWANSRHTGGVTATFLCGDFNAKSGSQGYLADAKEYEDQFLKANYKDIFDKVYRQSSSDRHGLFSNDDRIDYIFMKKGGQLKVTSARAVFTQDYYGMVSDHYGYFAEFEPK